MSRSARCPHWDARPLSSKRPPSAPSTSARRRS
nr:MAG TPA: hypothetical protein [Caudoviricetes sp.]